MKRFIATVLTVLVGFGTLTPAAFAKANEKGAHNLAIGTTAAAAYLLSQKKTRTIGVVAAGGAIYAWKKHKDAVKERHARAKRLAYNRARTARYNRARALRNRRAEVARERHARAVRVANNRARTVRNNHAR